MITRNLVFLSHANPEDNRFVSWLAARLYAVGYEIWSDLTHLHGGERHWDDIETTIRHHAALVVVVLSRSSYNKRGVLDEIGLAAKVGRQLGRRVFLLPIIIDDLSYDDIPIRSARQNPDQPVYELLTSNRFKITEHPREINLFRLLAPQKVIDVIPSQLNVPSVRHNRLLVTFEDIDSLTGQVPYGNALEHGYRISWVDFVKKGGPGIRPREARNIVTQLLNHGFSLLATNTGLSEVEIGRRRGWFVSKNTPKGDRAVYLDWNGQRRWRALRGYSQRYNRHWHTAIRPFFRVTPPMFLEAQLWAPRFIGHPGRNSVVGHD